MELPEIQETIVRNRELAIALGVTGTPGIVVGSEISYGGLDAKEFQSLIDKAKGASAQNGAAKSVSKSE